ncbi:MAG: helix-turn-helix domain-containing protein [Chloroflexi bacterium]|nr:helix-turn-helix domain-containing protein [Chloroflexota bacterium]
MSDLFESIKQGLTEAIEFAQGEKQIAIIHEFTPVDVKAIRKKVGMSQSEFASAFGISLGTLRHWERGDRKPRGPALTLLNLIAKEPGLVMQVLRN